MLYFIAGMIISALIGILLNLLLYKQEKHDTQNKKFITSERLIIFIIDIIIAVIGFGVTLGVTNENERNIEKEHAIQMLEQTINYTKTQLSSHYSYTKSYQNGEISLEELRISNVINFDYYDNILAYEAILKNVNMSTYGDLMRYLQWAKNTDERIFSTSNKESIIAYNESRGKHILKLQKLLETCVNELKGNISKEEASEECESIRRADYAFIY